jgi:hypothetical protein
MGNGGASKGGKRRGKEKGEDGGGGSATKLAPFLKLDDVSKQWRDGKGRL